MLISNVFSHIVIVCNFSGETIKLKENPVNKRLEFDLSESSKRYEELFEVIFQNDLFQLVI